MDNDHRVALATAPRWLRPGPPNFRTAADYVLPLGKQKGRTVDDVAKTDEGLAYLAYWRQMLDHRKPGFTLSANEREIHTMLQLYLDDPTIAKEVDAAQRRKRVQS